MNRILDSYIKNFCEDYDITTDQFTAFSAYQICKKYNLNENEIIDSIIEGGGDGGLDSIIILVDKKYIYSLDEFNEYVDNINENSILDIYLIQGKEVNGVQETAFVKIKDLLLNLLVKDISKELKIQYKKPLIQKFELLNDCIIKMAPKTKNIYINIVYSYSGKKDKDSIPVAVKNKIDEIKILIKERTYIDETRVLIDVFDSVKLIDSYNRAKNKDYIIKFETFLKNKYKSEEENGFIMNVNIKNYYELITKDNEILDDLFEGNIRDFEGTSVEVNKNITKTLSEDFSSDFWWLNNGVTMIAEEYEPLPNDKAKLINPIIVNGLQTSYTIYNFFRNNLDLLESEGRTILLKIITTNDLAISDKIISYTNSQNRVKPAQLKATDPIQKDIEQVCLSEHIYYERRKNYYKNRGQDKHKIITLESLAQHLESIYYGNCSIARNNPTSLLKSDKLYKKLFNISNNINLYPLTAKIALNILNELKKIKKEKKDPFIEKYSVSLDIFKFYIMRIVVLILTENDVDKNYINIEISKINNDLVLNSVNYLFDLIEKNNFDIDNIINISKSKDLDSLIKSVDLSAVYNI